MRGPPRCPRRVPRIGASRKPPMKENNYLPMLAVLYGSAFVAAFNENTVNVALVSIMANFSISATTAQWLVTGYMVITAIVVTATAFLSKRLRLRTLFLAASGFLIGGLALSLVTPAWPLFLGSRLLQAVGTGIFIPLMMSTVLVVAPKQKMGTYLSIGTVLAFAYALKRRRLARNAQEGQTSVAVAEAAPAVVVDTVPAMAAGRD